MLAALDLKLFRDLAKMKGQIIAVSLVMACGIAMMITTRGLILSARIDARRLLLDRRFADVFCELKRAPNALRARLAEIPGWPRWKRVSRDASRSICPGSRNRRTG